MTYSQTTQQINAVNLEGKKTYFNINYTVKVQATSVAIEINKPEMREPRQKKGSALDKHSISRRLLEKKF